LRPAHLQNISASDKDVNWSSTRLILLTWNKGAAKLATQALVIIYRKPGIDRKRHLR
jgi:hypothetical protein